MSTEPEQWGIAWCEENTELRLIHLARKDRSKPDQDETACGRLLQGHWVSRSPGLFFKRRVLKPRDGTICTECLRISGGRGPIARRHR